MVRSVLLEFIDSPFMQAVGVGIAIAAGSVALGAAVLLWRLTRAGLRQWKCLRAAPGPALVVHWLGAGLLLLPAALVGLVAVLVLAGGAASVVYERERDAQYKVALQQHQDSVYQAVAGRYAQAGAPPPDTGWADAASNLPPGRASLVLRRNGTFSYHSTIATDVTTDTAGTWKLEKTMDTFKLMDFEPVFYQASTAKPGGLRAIVMNDGRINFYGAYYLNNQYTRFDLPPTGAPH